jgi:hypothetical protein
MSGSESPERWLEPTPNAAGRQDYLTKLAERFAASDRLLADKLDQFPKYVPSTAVGRFLGRFELYKKIQDIPGAIIEAGVLSGSGLFSFVHFAFLLEPHNFYRRIVGFDTFEGFPALSDVDREGTSAHMHVGSYADDSLGELNELARVHEGFRLLPARPQIELVKGDIVETVPAYVASHQELVVSLLYLDCDLLEPTKTCLDHFLPRMPRGAVVVFDELGLPDYPGETAAITASVGIGRLRLQRLPYLKLSFAVLE